MMNKYFRAQSNSMFLALLTVLCIGLICYGFLTHSYDQKPNVYPEKQEVFLSAQFFSKAIFAQNQKSAPYTLEGGLFAAVVPHYEPALWSEAALLQGGKSYDTVVVIGPNHSGEGANLTVSDYGWNTEFGTLKGDKELAALILDTPKLQGSPATEAIQAEWSVAVHMPYLKKQLPDSKVVAVTISRSAKTSQLTALGAILSQLAANRRILVLCSIDFSHYQTPEIAAKNDLVTQNIIESGDWEALRKLRSEHLDSPETMVVFLALASLQDHPFVQTDHFNFTYPNGARIEAGTYFIYTLA